MTDPFYKTKDWYRARAKTLLRDNYACVFCGASVRGKRQSRVDHILPRADRPDLALDLGNLRTLCPSCDNKRHAEKGRRGADWPTVDHTGFPANWRGGA